MASIAQMVKQHNDLIDLTGIKAKKVETFPDRKTAETRLKRLKDYIANANGLPTSKDFVPKRGNNIQEEEVMDRERAIANDIVLYWPGYPCGNGHNSVRYAKTGVCKKCYQMFRADEMDQKDMSKDKYKKKETVYERRDD